MREKFPTAGKDWNCTECGRLIPQGSEYQRLEHSNTHQATNCCECAEIWEEIQARRGEAGFVPPPHEWGTLRSLLRRSPTYKDLLDDFGT